MPLGADNTTSQPPGLAAAPHHVGGMATNPPTPSTSFSSTPPFSMQPSAAALDSTYSDINRSDQPASPSSPLSRPGAVIPRPFGPSLAVVAARSSSLPLFHMGNGYSKSASVPSSSSTNSKLNSTGSKLKRAFAGRRKKSEDATTLFMNMGGVKEQDSVQDQSAQQGVLDTQLTSPPTSAQVIHPISPSNPQSRGAKLTQLVQVFHSAGKKAIKSPVQEGSDSPPPPPPKPTASEKLPNTFSRNVGAMEISAANNRGSIIPISPGMTSALNYMRIRDEEIKEGPDKSEKADTKDTRRNSDSTISHHTIRPGAPGSRTSRPVSMAESFQSNHTIVPVNKRWSSTVADFGMPEEDDDSFKSADENLTNTPEAQPSPASSLRAKNRRSMSLNLGQLPPRPLIPTFLPGQSAADLKHPSYSISEGVPPVAVPSSARDTPTANAQQQSAGKSKLTPWISSPKPTALPTPGRRDHILPSLPPNYHAPSLSPTTSSSIPTFRQTAYSMTSGFAPAAGLAKRAVEKMGRVWGMNSSSSNSGHNSPSSTGAAPSSYPGTSNLDYGLCRTNSNQSNPSIHFPFHHGKGKAKRTPNASSESYSVSSSTTSGSDSDAFSSTSGPVLGKLIRGPMKNKHGAPVAGGVVFGLDLKTVVRDTAVNAGRPQTQTNNVNSEGENMSTEIKALEGRKLPAIVARCAQHLLTWGIQEEGLFRLTGRPAHVAKLRGEFDTGVDYDMTECAPGDLDPHAVASVFKAYLRELPEPILTHKLMPYFDAAINQESSANAEQPIVHTHSGSSHGGLPANPKMGGFTLPALRKPPSLSTLAIPSFSTMRPASKSLINALKSLIAQLPQENRDLILTVVELIRRTAKEFKETKMPLSNLLLVFCPSLNMSPPLLRVLCEQDVLFMENFEASPIFDISRQSVHIDIAPVGDDMVDESKTSDVLGQSEPSGVPDSRRSRVDLPSDARTLDEKMAPDDCDPQRRWTVVHRPDIPTVYLDSHSRRSSVSSVSVSSGQPTHSRDVSITSSNTDDTSLSSDGYSSVSANATSLSSSPPPLMSFSVESVATPSTSSGRSSPTPLRDGDVQDFCKPLKDYHETAGAPKIAEPSPYALPTCKRPYISNPILQTGAVQFPTSQTTESLLALPPSKRRSIPVLSLPTFSPISVTSDLPSPADSFSSRSLGRKRPSLHLLFSKRSTSSLGGASSFGTKPFISSPIARGSGPYMWSSNAASDSSVSTPQSAFTAPQASVSQLPPVLDTPIEGSSLSLGPGFEIGPSTTDNPDEISIEVEDAEAPASSKDSAMAGTSHIRPVALNRGRGASVSSVASSNHLGLLEDDEQEDWTQSVLLAADKEGRWAAKQAQKV